MSFSFHLNRNIEMCIVAIFYVKMFNYFAITVILKYESDTKYWMSNDFVNFFFIFLAVILVSLRNWIHLDFYSSSNEQTVFDQTSKMEFGQTFWKSLENMFWNTLSYCCCCFLFITRNFQFLLSFWFSFFGSKKKAILAVIHRMEITLDWKFN